MLRSLPLAIGLRYARARGHSFFVSFITWASLLGLAVGVGALIIVLSAMNGFEAELRTRLLSLSAHANLLLEPASASRWHADVAALRAAPGVLGAAPYLDVDTMLSRQPAMSGAVLHGIDPAAEASVSAIQSVMIAGSLADLTPGSDRVVLGRTLAVELDAVVGDRVTAIVPTRLAARGELVPRIREFTVSGIFEAGLQDHDSLLALANLADVEELSGRAGPDGLRLKVADVMAAPAIARAAAARLAGPVTVRDWTQENAAYFRAIRIEKSMMSIILLLIVGVAAFNIVSSLVMVVDDKRTDIAILRTLGASPGQVRGIFITQGLVIGCLGVVAGTLFGVLTSLNLTGVVAFFERLFHFQIMDPEVYYIQGIPSELHGGNVVTIAAAAFALVLLATLYPASRAAHTQPAEALRYE